MNAFRMTFYNDASQPEKLITQNDFKKLKAKLF